MSIAVLTQVYDEVRRLAIAGSTVAGGDFRLKKLIAPLEQAGTKAPVFAKAAQAATALVDSHETTSAPALLELATLVSAVLYTQGTTGLAGELQLLETTDWGMQTTQASARTLKPLLDALTSTGSGRLEIIKDAHSRGAFRDLRLVKSSLAALDDVYPEIADFVSNSVLPLYGRSILPALKLSFDVKGNRGHVRRLSLMHRIDPSGTREMVKEALESGSKEVRIAAIECLGGDPEDLKFLVEQSAAKSKEVRAAALKALAHVNSDEAVAVLQQGLLGTDIALATGPVQQSRNPKLLKFVIDESQRELEKLLQTKDPKEVTKSTDRLEALLTCLAGRDDHSTETFLLECFAQRAEILKATRNEVGKGLVRELTVLMANCSAKSQRTLVDSHASLDWDLLETAFKAACLSRPPAEVYALFSTYITAKGDEKKKSKDFAFSKRDIIITAIIQEWQWHRDYDLNKAPLAWDPRWLDLAVQVKRLDLVQTLARPGNAEVNTMLTEAFEASFKKSKALHDVGDILSTLIRIQHPDATDNLIRVLTRYVGPKSKHVWGIYWIARLIPDLPKASAIKLEELLPTLHEQAIEGLIESVTALKNKA